MYYTHADVPQNFGHVPTRFLREIVGQQTDANKLGGWNEGGGQRPIFTHSLTWDQIPRGKIYEEKNTSTIHQGDEALFEGRILSSPAFLQEIPRMSQSSETARRVRRRGRIRGPARG